MKATELKQKLHHYIDTAQEKKLKAIYVMVKEEIETYNHWEDKEFISELERREKSYLNGTAKTYTIEQTVARAKQAIKKAKS